jgi:hypothetical protein
MQSCFNRRNAIEAIYSRCLFNTLGGEISLIRRLASRRLAASAAVTAGLLVVTTSAAEANVLARFTWGGGSYHRSDDFRNIGSPLHIGVMCKDGGKARTAYAGIRNQMDTHRLGFASYNQPCDGTWHNDPRVNYDGRHPGASFLQMEWYGSDNNGDAASAPKAGAGVTY